MIIAAVDREPSRPFGVMTKMWIVSPLIYLLNEDRSFLEKIVLLQSFPYRVG